MADTDWITHRRPMEADGDGDGDVKVRYNPVSENYNYLHWSHVGAGVPWEHTSLWVPPALEPAKPESVDAKPALAVGQTWRRRDGEVVAIDAFIRHDHASVKTHPFVADGTCTYTADGIWSLDGKPTEYDLVELISEAEPQHEPPSTTPRKFVAISSYWAEDTHHAADRACRPTPQPELTHHITPDDFRRWWRETGSASPAPSPEMLLTANAWAQYCLDRWGRPTPQPPADGEVAELVKRLKSVKRNDNSIPSGVHWGLSDGTIHHHRIHVTSNHASDCDRAAELLEAFASDNWIVPSVVGQHPQPVPVAIPGEEYHEDMGPVTWWRLPVEEPPWVGTPNDSDWPGYHTHFTPAPPTPCNAHALPLPTNEEFTS